MESNLKSSIIKKQNYSELIFIEDGPNIYEKMIHKSIIKLIYDSRKTIDIVSPYFVPDSKIFSALKNALLSGVKINFFIPGIPDKKTLYLATKYYLGQLIKLGLKVHIMENLFVHSKFMIFDNKYTIFGTANLDIRSLFLNYELMNISSCPKIRTYLINLIKDYKNLSYLYIPSQKSRFKLFFRKLFVLTFTPLF